MSVTRQALEHIQRMIIEGDLKPGDRLPPEHELADRLGVSRGSFREAVGALSHANILDVRRGDGTYVTSLEPDELMSGVVFAWNSFRPATWTRCSRSAGSCFRRRRRSPPSV